MWLNLNLATLSQPLVGFWKTDVLIYLWLEPADCMLNAENGCRALFWDHQLFIFSVCSASSAELWLSTSCTVALGLSGGMGPPPGHWPGWEPSFCVRQYSQKSVRLFLSTGRKNTIKVLNNGAVSSGFDGATFPVLFRKMGLEKV